MRSLQYAQAWSRVHFFRHGARGRYRARFDGYLSSVIAHGHEARAFHEGFGPEEMSALEQAWRDYVRVLEK